MNYYRITKYNPKFRDKNDCYLLNEWTSISDIGTVFSNGVFTMEEYLNTEACYINAITIILKENRISRMKIDSLEKYEDIEKLSLLSVSEKELFSQLNNNEYADLREIEQIAKLALRELLWCKLYSDSNELEITFGYDYYMYIQCDDISQSTSQTLSANGLYIELMSHK